MINPTKQDFGRRVVYVPTHANGSFGHPDVECGRITSFNDHSVFVLYDGDANPKGTYREDLHWEPGETEKYANVLFPEGKHGKD